MDYTETLDDLRKVLGNTRESLANVSQLAADRLDLLDRIRRIAKSRCLRDSDKLVTIQQILKGY